MNKIIEERVACKLRLQVMCMVVESVTHTIKPLFFTNNIPNSFINWFIQLFLFLINIQVSFILINELYQSFYFQNCRPTSKLVVYLCHYAMPNIIKHHSHALHTIINPQWSNLSIQPYIFCFTTWPAFTLKMQIILINN